MTPSDPDEDRQQIAEAVKVARRADVIVLAIGGNEQTSREAWTRNHMGDRTSLDLVGRQDELVDAMLATGKPVVALSSTAGRWRSRNLRETVAGDPRVLVPRPGTRHARWPRCCSATSIRAASCRSPFRARSGTCRRSTTTSRRRGAATCSTTSRRSIPFGFGLSYTTFAIDERAAGARRPSAATDRRTCSVDVTNTGDARRRRGGADVHSRPRELGDAAGQGAEGVSAKVTLRAGRDARPSSSRSRRDALAFQDIDMKYVVEPGEFDDHGRHSSRDGDLQTVTLRVEP